jgi:hypothetical protein
MAISVSAQGAGNCELAAAAQIDFGKDLSILSNNRAVSEAALPEQGKADADQHCAKKNKQPVAGLDERQPVHLA